MAEAKLCVIAVFFINFHPALVNGIACKFVKDQSPIDLYVHSDSLENGHDLPIVENTPILRKKYPFDKKWYVGRISRKQYEIINMLWKKPSTPVVNIETGYTKSMIETITASMTPMRKKNSVRTDSRKYIFSVPTQSFPFARYVRTSSTPSYIEFYYLDEIETNDHHTTSATMKKNKDMGELEPHYFNEGHRRYVIRSPLLALNINEPPTYTKSFLSDFQPDGVFRARQTSLSDENGYLQTNIHTKHLESFRKKTYDINRVSPIAISLTMTKPTRPTTIRSFTTKSTTTIPTTKSTVVTMTVTKGDNNERETNIMSIKRTLFSATKRPPEQSKRLTETTIYDKIKFFEMYDSHTRLWLNINDSDKDINNSQRIKLENIYDSMGEKLHMNMKFAKKEVAKYQNESEKNFSKTLEDVVSKKRNETNSEVSEKNTSTIIVSNKATFAEYPFIAVYFYERLQVHCDAAIFSTHWLLASGACLSRHRDDPPGEERSAFVTYCSDNWWESDHINYVKQTIIHPKYNHKDFSKRHLYNIGVIQVISSLSMNCHDYAPIPVMSHTYIAEPEGSMAVAVGFGLDRKIEIKNRDVEKVFCLSLPPYLGEEMDPIHGGILLVEGKLVGLYLQEERRRLGLQSAQYTSIWHLFPWVLNVAREPDESSFCISLEEGR